MRNDVPFGFLMVAIVIAGILGLVFQMQELPLKASQILAADGMTDIQLTGYKFLACGNDDTTNTGFTGKKNDHIVKGVICGSWVKGYTVRYLP